MSQEQLGLNGAMRNMCKHISCSSKRKPAPWEAGLVIRAYSPNANHPLDGGYDYITFLLLTVLNTKADTQLWEDNTGRRYGVHGHKMQCKKH